MLVLLLEQIGKGKGAKMSQNHYKTYKDDIKPLIQAADLLDAACVGQSVNIALSDEQWGLLTRVRARIVQRLGEEGSEFVR